MKKDPTIDGVKILHDRYIGNDPRRKAMLEQARIDDKLEREENEQAVPRPFPKHDLDRIQNPHCPYCFAWLIPFSLEFEDGSGWMAGWTCNCDSIKIIESSLEDKS